MRIQDMFIDSTEIFGTTHFQGREFSSDPTDARHLLYRLAVCHLNVPGKLSMVTRAYPAYGLLHLISGSLQYNSQLDPKQAMTISGDMLLLIDCHIPHKLTAKFSCEFEILYFDGYSAPYFCDQLFNHCSYFNIASTNELLQKYRLLLQDSCTSILSNLYLTDLLTRITLRVAPAADHIPSYLLQIKELFDTSYYKSFSLEELEQQFHVNRYRVCKDFKQHFQLSPMQYLHQVRVQAAQVLLRENDMHIHEIADEVGYENVNHFIHHFKKTAGTTPAAYRQNISSYL